ncbi:MAG TPA: serine hydrolase [Roseiflexaceae bacterium]|nr:serine hydrolase [Roseiflexaceae bacterium]
MALSERVDDRASAPTAPHSPYLAGLDGLRALAVVAVLLYHAGYNVAGGYLGVESFFVLSGFLITTLLVADQRRHGRIRLGAFWLRRARRLLPALAATLAGSLLLSAVLSPGELRPLGADTLAALLYVMNWKLIIAQQSYFDALSRPSLIQHLWSLAIEEQFYLLWPLACAAVMRLLRPAGFLAAALAAALASSLLMAALYETGADISRIYYGTDTRASALLIGAALALIWTHDRRQLPDTRRDTALERAGVLALAFVLASYAWLHEQHPLLYLGGFQLVSLATAIVIAATTAPGARLLPALLEVRPLRWIGRRSYSLYLWHWPIFLLVSPEAVGPWSRWSADVLRIGLTVLLASASYRFVEQPVRTHGFTGAWALLRSTPPRALLQSVLKGWTPGPALGALLVVALSIIPVVWQSTRVRSSQAAPAELQAAGAPAIASATAPPTTQRSDVELDQRTRTAEPLAQAAPSTVSSQAGVSDAQTERPSPQPTAPTPTPLPALDAALTGELQDLLDDVVDGGFVPGVVLSVSVPGHAPWSGASGLADRAEGRAMAPDTPVRIASVSKMFTAVVVLQLVEEGRLTLDEPIATWLPDSVPGGRRITVRQLLQHTSGLYDYLEDRRLIGEMQRDTRYVWEPQELIDYAARFPQRAIGRWDYSSTNYVLLGMLAERVTGQPLAQQVRQRIFDPLGIYHAAFLPQEPVPAMLAHGYSYENDLTTSSMSFAFATANLAMTGGDLERFGRALFSEELLRVETRNIMLGKFVSGRGQYDMPALEYGLGVMRNRLPIGPTANGDERPDAANLVLGHIGGYGGFRSVLWYAPDSGVVIAIGLNQAQTDPNDLAALVLDRVLASMGQ